ncbi:NADP-dependent oxidoreductase domain-containing protein [Fusarium redolens]|uniref:NADP-dependent oxidoreductase domain-containing protein n=1 Tax=Fusarium redolens TaxID=48865 RepID=A0A9P9KRK1_FUSRE|nr:NADP-dependent oxidoreductase domain-containing protein [Fusarium redolens]KAH7267236.1 NADP-dependent oxidoreductase domain-containing protein [Fusarium redolens]
MTHQILGKQVGPIGFGLMGLTARPLPDKDAFAAIRTALDSGCNWLNGGEFYGPPDANSLALIRRYLEKYPEDADRIVLTIKGGLGPNYVPLGTKENIRRSIDDCIETLGPVGRIASFEIGRKDPNVDYEEDTLAAISEYVKEGKIDGISCSELNANTLRSAAKKFKIAALEIELSLFTTDPLTNGLLEVCGELDIPILAYSPLGRGFLGGQIKSVKDLPENDMRAKMHPRWQGENFQKNIQLVDDVEALAKKKGCTVSQIAINWLLSLSRRPGMPMIVPIPGSSKPDRIRENATIIDLTDEDLCDIDRLLASFTPAGDRYPPQHMKYVSA